MKYLSTWNKEIKALSFLFKTYNKRINLNILALVVPILAFVFYSNCYAQEITITNITDYDETSTPKGNCMIRSDSDISTNGILIDAVSYGSSSWGIDKINTVKFIRIPSTGGKGDDRLKSPGLNKHISIGGDTQLRRNCSSNHAPFMNLSSAYQGMLSGGTYRSSGYKTYVSFQKLTIGVAYEFQIWVHDPNYTGNYTESLVRFEHDSGGVFKYRDNGRDVTNKNLKISKNNSGKTGGLGSFITAKFTAAEASCKLVVYGYNAINGIQLRQISNIPKFKYELHFNDTAISGGSLPTDWRLSEDKLSFGILSESWRGFNATQQGSVQPRISTDIKREGSGAVYMQLNSPTASLSQRTEMGVYHNIKDQNYLNLSPGEERYYSCSFRLDPDFPDPQGWFNIHQTKQGRSPYLKPTNIPFIQFGFYDGDGFLKFRAAPSSFEKILQPKRGIWYDMVIGWRFSPKVNEGFVNCWIKEATAEGYTKFERKNIKVGYDDRPYTTWAYNFGMYKQAEQQAYKMHFDIVKIGKKFEDVVNRTPLVPEGEIPQTAILPDGVYFIQNPAGTIRITSPTDRIITKSESYENSAKWEFKKHGNYYTIKNLRNNEFLEVPYAACNADANTNNPLVQLGTWRSSIEDHQRWIIIQSGDDYFLRPLHCDKVIDRFSDNPNMHLWAFNPNNPNQNWKMIPANTCNASTRISGLSIAAKSSNSLSIAFDLLENSSITKYELNAYEKEAYASNPNTKAIALAEGTTSPITIENLEPKTNYTIVIRAICSSGNIMSSDSAIDATTADDTSLSVGDYLQKNKFQLAANPVQDTIRFSNDQANGLQYEIYSLSGILHAYGKYSNAGVEITNLSSGIYFIKIQNQTFKFLKE